jgi:hypothetical protein
MSCNVTMLDMHYLYLDFVKLTDSILKTNNFQYIWLAYHTKMFNPPPPADKKVYAYLETCYLMTIYVGTALQR